MQIRTCAQPIERVHEVPAKHAVVCLHGYTGYPGELALPAELLFRSGYDVFVPRYPGHGTSGSDFLTTGKRDWVGAAEDTVRWACNTYTRVSLIGHSMGGAIAIILARQFSIEQVVLYAPALKIPGLSLAKVTFLGIFIPRLRQSWQPDPRYHFFDERDDDDDSYLGSEYWSYVYPRQLRQLELIRREALQQLPETTSNILVITGGEDATVPKEVGQVIVDVGGGENRWIHLEKATHMIPYDYHESTREQAMEETLTWLNFQ
jgi:carboxylesterase